MDDDDDDDARAQRQSFAAPAWQRRANVPYITTSAQDGGAYDDLSGYDSSSQLNVGSSPGSSTDKTPLRAARDWAGHDPARGTASSDDVGMVLGSDDGAEPSPDRAESSRSLATVIRGARAERPERPERAPRVSRTAELQEEAIEAAAAAFASTRDFAEGSRGTAPEETYHDAYATIHRARRRSSLHATRQRRVSDAMMREDILREMRLRGQNIVNDLTDQTKRRDARVRAAVALQTASRVVAARRETAPLFRALKRVKAATRSRRPRGAATRPRPRRREYEAYVATLALRFRETRALEKAPSLWDATCQRATTAPYGKSLAERSLGMTVSGYLSDAGNRRLVEAHDRPLCTVTWLPPAAPEPVATRSARNSFSGLESIQESTLFGGPSLATRLTVETAKAPKRTGAKRPATSYSRALEKFVPPAVAAPAPPALHVRRFRPTEVFTYGDGGAPRRSEVRAARPSKHRSVSHHAKRIHDVMHRFRTANHVDSRRAPARAGQPRGFGG
ncbi:hypothetical protein JL721_9278 [Aureococcus anophagefferens]|nr:hypothetical protein JL721_9278 [Aureococcus anophagefferens]